jgi:TonB family protein
MRYPMRRLFGCLQTVVFLLACVFSGIAQQTQARLVEAVAPVYPMLAVYSSTAGEVTVRLTIEATGMVTAAKVIHGPKLLTASAEAAARKWRFAASGSETEVNVSFVFRILPKGTPEPELATRFRYPYEIEIRRVVPEATTNSDPSADPPTRRD